MAHTIRTWYLVCTVFLLMLCITGLPLIFWHEIEHLMGDEVEPAVMAADAPRASLDAIVADAMARRPTDAVQFVSRDAEEPDLWSSDQFEDAVECFERAARHDPKMAQARTRLAQELSARGKV